MGKNIYDILIIGGGPAGFTAGLYAARARMKTLLIESLTIMGQATMTATVENYPGILKTSGFGIISKFKEQAMSFGLECTTGTVAAIHFHKEDGRPMWRVVNDTGEHFALSVIVATGARAKQLSVPGEKEFIGSGVSYCATCDGAFFKDKDIVVVGGGDTAVEEAMFLTKFGKKVTIVHRRDRFRATKILQERVKSNEKIDFVWDSVVESIYGDGKVEKVLVKNIKTEKTSEILCDGVFVFVGWKPNTDFLKNVAEIKDNGAVVVDNAMKTSAPGIFACGDCCSKVLHQIVTASGDGATAAFSAGQYVDGLNGTAYI